MHESKDTDLVRYIRNGNEKAFREIYDRYNVQMYYIAKKYVKDGRLAEDAVQDIFVKLWEKRFQLDATKSIRGFLFTMLRNHVLNMLRDNKKEIVDVSKVNMELLPKKNLTEEELIYKEYHEVVKKGLDELSGRKREVFELKAYSGLTNSEVAEMLKINIRTVKTHYYNSSKFIRAYLKDHAGIFLFLFSLTGVAVFFL
ncbi:MAG: RNA polymerase sigma-70 factor [Balneolaceae bacterium]|nr:RNA polymerase sigma-70 factor [Balneolaceae bacterium]